MNTDIPSPSGFRRCQNRLEAMVSSLGGSHFVRVALAHEVAITLRGIVTERLGFAASRGLYSAEYLLATEDEFETAISEVEAGVCQPNHALPDERSNPLMGGFLVLRDTRLSFETPAGALLLASAAQDAYSESGRWHVSLTDAANPFFDYVTGRKPAQTSTGAASKDGALRTLRRIASNVFCAPLHAIRPEQAAAE